MALFYLPRCSFRLFLSGHLVQAAQISDRNEIEPILNTFMAIFRHYAATFIVCSDRILMTHLEGELSEEFMSKLTEFALHHDNVIQMP